MNVLISHVFGYANKGDWVLLSSLIKCIVAVEPNAKIYGICRNPTQQAKYFPNVSWVQQLGVSERTGLRRRMENLSGIIFGVMRDLALPITTAKQDNSLSAAYDNADVIIACPGGYLEDSNPSIITNLVHLALGIRRRTPVILAPQSIGPFSSRFWQWATGNLLRRCLVVCTREDYSAKTVIDKLKVPLSKVRELPDMAFYFSYRDQNAARSEIEKLGLKRNQYVCITAIDWYFPFSEDPEKEKVTYIDALSKVIKQIQLEYGFRVLILKQVESAAGVNGDDEIMHAIQVKAEGAAIASYENYAPEVMRGIIEDSAGFIGSRMHSNVFAIQAGVPLVALSYLPKTNGIMSMVGLGEYVVPITSLNHERLFSKFSAAISQREMFCDASKICATIGAGGRESFCEILGSAMRLKEH